MKKIFTLLSFIACFSFSYSQLRLSIMGGPQTSKVQETNSIPGWDTSYKPYYSGRSGLNLGVMAVIPLVKSGRLAFQPGIFYMTKGRKYFRVYDTARIQTDTLLHEYDLNTNYIDIPLNFTVRLPLGRKANFMLSAGPYLSFFYS